MNKTKRLQPWCSSFYWGWAFRDDKQQTWKLIVCWEMIKYTAKSKRLTGIICRKRRSKAGVFNRGTGTGRTHNEIWFEHRVEGSERVMQTRRGRQSRGPRINHAWHIWRTKGGWSCWNKRGEEITEETGPGHQGHDHHCIGYGLLPNKTMVHLSESVRAVWYAFWFKGSLWHGWGQTTEEQEW